MHSNAERTLGNLHVLAALAQNDKLLTNDDAFDIHAPTTLRAMWRMWSGESRQTNMQRVRTCIRSAMDFASTSLEEVNSLAPPPPSAPLLADDVTILPVLPGAQTERGLQLRIETLVMHHYRVFDALRAAGQGLGNLLQTYRDDPALAAQVSLLVREIEDFVTVMAPHSQQLRRHFASSAATAET